MSLGSINQRIKQTFDKYFILPEFQQQILELSANEYHQFINNHSNLNFNQLVNFCDFFNISLDEFASKNFDLCKARPGHLIPNFQLEEKYLENAGTYISTINTVLDYIRDNYNEELLTLVCTKFNLTHTLLINPHNKVNLLLLIDIINFIKSFVNFNTKDFQAMAYRSYQQGMRKNNLKNDLPKECINSFRHELVHQIVEKQSNYDSNFKYSLVKKKKHYEIIGFLSQDLIKESKAKSFFSPEILEFKAQTVNLFPLFFELDQFVVFHSSEEVTKNMLMQKFYIHV